jgi:hypothetical protein
MFFNTFINIELWGLEVSSSRGFKSPYQKCSGSYRKIWKYNASSSSSSSPEDENLTPRSFQSSFFFLNLSRMLESQNDYDSNILSKGKARMNNTNEELDFSSSSDDDELDLSSYTRLFLYYPLQFVEGTSKFIEEKLQVSNSMFGNALEKTHCKSFTSF